MLWWCWLGVIVKCITFLLVFHANTCLNIFHSISGVFLHLSFNSHKYLQSVILLAYCLIVKKVLGFSKRPVHKKKTHRTSCARIESNGCNILSFSCKSLSKQWLITWTKISNSGVFYSCDIYFLSQNYLRFFSLFIYGLISSYFFFISMGLFSSSQFIFIFGSSHFLYI